MFDCVLSPRPKPETIHLVTSPIDSPALSSTYNKTCRSYSPTQTLQLSLHNCIIIYHGRICKISCTISPTVVWLRSVLQGVCERMICESKQNLPRVPKSRVVCVRVCVCVGESDLWLRWPVIVIHQLYCSIWDTQASPWLQS